jgi:hypothetical protein
MVWTEDRYRFLSRLFWSSRAGSYRVHRNVLHATESATSVKRFVVRMRADRSPRRPLRKLNMTVRSSFGSSCRAGRGLEARVTFRLVGRGEGGGCRCFRLGGISAKEHLTFRLSRGKDEGAKDEGRKMKEGVGTFMVTPRASSHM